MTSLKKYLVFGDTKIPVVVKRKSSIIEVLKNKQSILVSPYTKTKYLQNDFLNRDLMTPVVNEEINLFTKKVASFIYKEESFFKSVLLDLDALAGWLNQKKIDDEIFADDTILFASLKQGIEKKISQEFWHNVFAPIMNHNELYFVVMLISSFRAKISAELIKKELMID